ncbi:MAG: FAA hydrolase family protein [Sphingomonadales bacterium]|nr:MAG: FAA hydrolase family protein [Sphingomonadales bacterium]
MNIPTLTIPTVAIADSAERFPVRRIFCVGQNYADHTREMGGDPDRQPPFFFSKPADAVVADGSVLAFPPRTQDLHHEVELVIALGGGGADIAAGDALDCVFGWSVGVDFTRRDLQAEAKKAGRPWDMAKGFDQSAPVGAIRLGAPPAKGPIGLSLDGAVRQAGDLADMIWSVPEIIAMLSTYVTLAPGDLIFTGTPAGVGPVLPGQAIVASVCGVDLRVAYRG